MFYSFQDPLILKGVRRGRTAELSNGELRSDAMRRNTLHVFATQCIASVQ